MPRTVIIVGAVLLSVVVPAAAGAPGPSRTTLDKVARSQLVLTGKVTGIAPDAVLIGLTQDDPNKLEFRVATIQIESGILGAENITHVRVGFRPPVKQTGPRRGPTIELKEGQKSLFYLVKHPVADFYIISPMSPPADTMKEPGKKELEAAKQFSAVMADPLKGLRSDSAQVRARTAAILVTRYRARPDTMVGAGEETPIPAEESRLILRTLAEAEWAPPKRPIQQDEIEVPTPMQAFFQLTLKDKDGWTRPKVMAGENYYVVNKAAYKRWLEGAGKDYVIKRIVPGTNPKK